MIRQNRRHINRVEASMKPRNHGVVTILLGALVAVAATALPAPVLGQTEPVCSSSARFDVAAALDQAESEADRLVLEEDLYRRYQYCASDPGLGTSKLSIAIQQFGVVYQGSTYYESMPSCGYDPQKRQFACPVTVKQRAGFGSAPFPGSREYVLNCVATAAGSFLPVGYDSVHLADERFGNAPSWQFAVIATAIDNLGLLYPLNGQTRIARSILSWNLKPTSCNYLPIWGNVIDYQIRLDP